MISRAAKNLELGPFDVDLDDLRRHPAISAE